MDIFGWHACICLTFGGTYIWMGVGVGVNIKKKTTCQHEKTLEVSLNLKTAIRLQNVELWLHVALHLDSNPGAHTQQGITKLSAPFLWECWLTPLAQGVKVHPVRNFEVLPYDGYRTVVLSHQAYDGRKLRKLLYGRVKSHLLLKPAFSLIIGV